MKKFIFLSLLLVILLISIPIVTIFSSEDFSVKKDVEIAKGYKSKDISKSLEKVKNQEFTIYDVDKKTNKKINDYDFTKYVLAKEMPIDYEIEALKAQAIATYTYYSLKREKKEQIKYNSKSNSLFYSENKLKEKWGSAYNSNNKKLEKVLNEVFPEVIKYKGELIESVSFEYCAGVTENGQYIYNENKPYLKSVSSPYDQFSEENIKVYKFSEDEVKEKLKSKYSDIKFNSNYQEWFKDIEYSESGNVINLKVGDKKLSGKEVAKIFKLKSSDFDILYSFEEFIFNVKGKGDFVGMSKYGANKMAKQGSCYKEILKHYYSGVEIVV